MTDHDHAILDTEARQWKYAGAKEAHVREVLGMSPTAYYVELRRLLDDPATEAARPQEVRRLRRIRDARRGVRSAGRL